MGLVVAVFFGPPLAVAFAVFAAPYASAAALMLELLGLRHWCFYAIAAFTGGVLAAYPNWSNLPPPEGTEWPDQWIESTLEFWLVIASATFGGIIYWALAGRSAGYWKVGNEADVKVQKNLLSILFVTIFILIIAWILFMIYANGSLSVQSI